VCHDISSFNIAFSLPFKSPGQFSRVKGSPVYIYGYVSFSSVMCSKVHYLLGKAGIIEQRKLLEPSPNVKSSASYFPYFYADEQCKTIIPNLVSTNRISKEDQIPLQKQLEKIGLKLSSKLEDMAVHW